MNKNFWQVKSLSEMNSQEWESICDGCGLCCLHKLMDSETEEVTETGVACELLNCESCQCSDYANRQTRVSDCVQLTPDTVGELFWLPETCGYRLLSEGKDLQWWHPLVSGSTETVHSAGISARGRCISESDVDEDYWEQMEQKLGIRICHDS